MKVDLIFGVVLVFLMLVPYSFQYGSVFVDNVVPVNEDQVYISNTRSETVDTRLFQVHSLSIADPAGFSVDIPISIDISSSEQLDLTGELGIGLGGPNTLLVSLTSNADMTLISEDFFFSGNSILLNQQTSVDFGTEREFFLNADGIVNFDASILMALQSVIGDVEITSPEIRGAAPSILGGAEFTFLVDSRTGFVNFHSGLDTVFTSDLLYFRSRQRIEATANNNIVIHAEDAVIADAGVAKLSALGEMTIFSNRSVDISTPSLIEATSAHLAITSQESVYLSAFEDDLSQITSFAKDTMRLNAQENSILSADNANFIASERVVLIANVLNWSAIEDILIGSDQTNNVDFDAEDHFLEFTLLEDSGDELLFDASQQILFYAVNIVGFEGENMRVAGSSFIGIAEQSTFTAENMLITTQSEIDTDDNFFKSTNGQIFEIEHNMVTDARRMRYLGDLIQISVSNEIDYVADHFSAFTTGTDLTITDQSAIFAGGNIEATATDSIVIRPHATTGFADVAFSALKSSRIINDNYDIDTDLDITFRTNFGDLNMNIFDDVILKGVLELNMLTDGSSSYIAHAGDAPFNAKLSINVVNQHQGIDDFVAFTFGEEMEFSAPKISVSGGSIKSASSGTINLRSLATISGVSSDQIYETIRPQFATHPDLGIEFNASEDMSITAVDILTFDSANQLLSQTKTGYFFTTPLIEVFGTEEIYFLADSPLNDAPITINATETFSVTSDGNIFHRAGSAFQLDTLTTSEFEALDSFNMTTQSFYNWLSDGDISFAGGYVNVFSRDFTLGSDGPIVVNADGSASDSEGSLTIKSHAEALFSSETTISVTTGEINVKAGDYLGFTAEESININAVNHHLELQPIAAIIDDDFTTTAGSYSFVSEELGAFFAVSSSNMFFSAQHAVYITSDEYIDFDFPTSEFRAQASNLWEADSEDSSYFNAGTSLTLTSTAVTGTIVISSDGHTGFKSSVADVVITSAAHFTATAGRVVMDNFGSGGSFLAPVKGDISVGSTFGSARLQSSGTITSTNQQSHLFTSTNGAEMSSGSGLYFYVEGILSDGTSNAIEFKSTDLYGDIVFDSQLSGYTLVSLKDITYTAANNISLTSAQGAQFLADTDITWDAPHGSFDVNGAEGIEIYAGEGVDPADVIFNQLLGAFQMLAGEQIILHSTGVVEESAITISAVSDIRFTTGNTGDVTFLADGLLDIFASGYYAAEATNNLYINSFTDSITINAVTQGTFETKGGPIRFSTFTNANGGTIRLTATAGDISFISGNSTNFFSRGATSLNANTGLTFTSIDGSIDVTAESATSFLNLISAGGIQARSFGNRRSPEDGLALRAANNIVFGTPNTKAIRFNTEHEFIVGTYSRPIITFNGGGGVGVDGFTIDSDGGVRTSTVNDFQSDIEQNLQVTSEFLISSLSNGPMTISSGKAMFVNSNTGILDMSAGTLFKIVSSDSVTGTTAGSVQLIQSGVGLNDQMLWTAPKVSIVTGSHQLMGQVLDGDLTNSFSLTTSGDGKIVGGLDSQSHVSFTAVSSFTATSNGLLSIYTLEDNGPISFTTAKSDSDIFITTDVQADMEFIAGGSLELFGNSLALTGSEVSVTAFDTKAHTDLVDGDIQIGAESTITGFAQQDMFLAGAKSVLIETVGSTAGVGAPLSITATGDVSMNADGDMLIANTPKEGGSLTFTALTDVLIENSNSVAFVNVVSDVNESFISTRDIQILVQEEFSSIAHDDYSIVARNRDANDGYGIHFITTESLTADITFQAIFGSIHFTAGTTISVTADGHPGDPPHDIVITTDHNGSFRGTTGTTITTANDISVTSRVGRVTLESNTGIEVISATTPSQTTPDILFSGNGIDDNGDYSIRFREEGGFPIQIIARDSMSVDGDEDLFFKAPTISLTATDLIEFYSAQAALLFAGETTRVFSDVVDYESENIVFETDYFHMNAQAGLVYTAQAGDLVIETNGLHGNINMYASAAVQFTSTNTNVDIVTDRRPNANVTIITSLGRIEFNPRLDNNFETFSIDFLAENGDLTFDGQGDDADVYVTAEAVVIDAEGGVDIQSLFPADPNIPGVIVQVDLTNIVSESDVIFSAADTLIITAPDISLNSNPPDFGLGGTTMMKADSISITSATTTFITRGQGDLLTVTSELADVTFNTPITAISFNSVMKIPYNNNRSPYFDPDVNPNTCVDGELFAIDALIDDPDYLISVGASDYENSWLLICVCEAGTPMCVVMPEPPCLPSQNPYFCSTNNYV